MAATSLPVRSTAGDVWDFVKGEAAAAAASILSEAASGLGKYAEKKVESGSSGVRASAAKNDTVRAVLTDLGLGGVSFGTIAVVVLIVVVLVRR